MGLEQGASRSASREAVRVLESLGLIIVRRKAGIEVQPKSRWDRLSPRIIAWRLAGPDREEQLDELRQLQAAVEPMAARLAAGRASAEDRHHVASAATQMSEAHDQADHVRLAVSDASFHSALLHASGNNMFAALGDVLSTHADTTGCPARCGATLVRLHSDAAVAIAAGRESDAAAAMSALAAEVDATTPK
jgi:DNA-binding FadR family transcriptional regulator